MITKIHSWKSIQLTEENITLPNNKNILHTSIKHPGAAVILPITDDGKVIITYQYRPSIKQWMLEIPAGTMEINEQPIVCAQRELEEETGYSAKEFIPLGELTPLAGFCDETQFIFIAKQLKKTDRLSCDDDEVIEVKELSVQEIENKILNGDITDSKTIAALFRAKLAKLV
ncbi:NUDIX hydrolase [Vibrio hannami]|uniref:NUDIX hydrolase n=1 Tax=Vibrio hannami TaxID=2717094 RepID=UPI00240FCD62|nr:NUDIX hydrolase [Vibrio hannami]MDG3085588.1 NUDIX hydrolase [Vibrio hannami]